MIYPTDERLNTEPPLGLMYIASTLREAGHRPKIIEGNFETVKRQFDNLPIEQFPDFIGITCMTSQYAQIVKMRDYFHECDIPLIYGGPHATVLPESLFTRDEHFIDFVVVGEGERAILKIMEDLYNGRVKPIEDRIVQGELISDLDSLPFPARDLVSNRYFKHKRASIMASRGCPFNCIYCQPTIHKLFGEKVRRRSVKNVLLEMMKCRMELGIRKFHFFDDTFTLDKDWVYEFCNEIEPYHFIWEVITRVDQIDYELLKRMKETGLHHISLGFESGSQTILNSYRKGTTVQQGREVTTICKRLGIKVHGYFMVGAIEETIHSLEETRDFIKQINPDTIFVTLTTPMPGTDLYRKACMEGRLHYDWQNMDILGSLFTTIGSKQNSDLMELEFLPYKTIVKARYDILRSFYLRKIRNPLYFFNFLQDKGLKYSWRGAQNILKGGQ